MFWFLLGSRYGRRPKPTPDSNPNPNHNPDPKPQQKRARVCIEPGNFSIADVDSEVQTTLFIFQVKNMPKNPFSQIAKASQVLESVSSNLEGYFLLKKCVARSALRKRRPLLLRNFLVRCKRGAAALRPVLARFGCGLGTKLGVGSSPIP